MAETLAGEGRWPLPEQIDFEAEGLLDGVGESGRQGLADAWDVGGDQSVAGGLPLGGVVVVEIGRGVLHVEHLVDAWVCGQRLDERSHCGNIGPEHVGVIEGVGHLHTVGQQVGQRRLCGGREAGK